MGVCAGTTELLTVRLEIGFNRERTADPAAGHRPCARGTRPA